MGFEPLHPSIIHEIFFLLGGCHYGSTTQNQLSQELQYIIKLCICFY